MNIYKIEQDTNVKYDTYDSAVVIANSAQEAQQMQPEQPEQDEQDEEEFEWAAPKDVTVTYIGIADPSFTKPCVIVSSFNAG